MGASCLPAKVRGKAKASYGYGLLSDLAPFYYRYIYYQGVATFRQQNRVTDMGSHLSMTPGVYFWVGVCREDSETLTLYQTMFS